MYALPQNNRLDELSDEGHVGRSGELSLVVDWRGTGEYLARLFTDYEPGIHWSQMQMQSGTTGLTRSGSIIL